MIKGFNPNQWLPKGQPRLNRQKTTVATIGTVATISNNTGATFSGLTLATLREANPTTNYNPLGFNNNGHLLSSNASGDRSHILINASGLSNITSGTVVSAILKFFISPGEANSTFTYVLRKMLVVSDVTQTTWTNRITATPWGTAGCLGDGVDRSSTVIGQGVVTNLSTGAVEVSGALLNQAVQDLISGVSTVFWFELEHVNDLAFNGNSVSFLSHASTDGLKPSLTVITVPSTALNISLTGIQSAASQGALTTAGSKAIAGIQATTSQGVIAPAIATPLTGIQATTSQGTLTTTGSKAIAGIQAATSQGVIAPAIATPLTGIQAATSQGTVTYSTTAASLELTLAGIQAAASQGAILPAVAATLTGIQSASSQGALTTTGNKALAGIQAATSQGTIAPAIAVLLTGIQAAASQGAVTYSAAGTLEITLSGVQATTSQGVIVPVIVAPLTGIQAATSQGVIAPTIAIPLTGIQAAAAQGSAVFSTAAASLEVTIAGIQAAAMQGALTIVGSKAIAGIQATTAQGIVTYSAAGTLEITLVGVQANSLQGTLTPKATLALAGVKATAFQGTIVYVTPVTTNRPNRKILRDIVDTRAIATSGRVSIRSGKATVFEQKVVNATARVELADHIGAYRPEKVLVRTTLMVMAIAKAGIPASIYQEKIARLVTDSRVLVTSRLLTVISGMPSVQIIAAAYPDGSLTPIRSGDVSYIHTTRYS